jgi:SAM-dependent methyltransferase
VAEAFHWFDSRQAVGELARVLRPGGSLTVLFTVWDTSFVPGLPPAAEEAVTDVGMRTGPTGGPKWMSGDWKAGFDGAPFEPLEERDIPFEHVTDRDGVIAYYLSISSIAARPHAERDDLAAQLRTLVPSGEHRLALSARLYRARRI